MDTVMWIKMGCKERKEDENENDTCRRIMTSMMVDNKSLRNEGGSGGGGGVELYDMMM